MAPMKSVQMCHSEVGAGMKGDMRRWTWSENDLGSLERTVEKFKRMLVETLDYHCDSALHTLKYNQADEMVKDTFRVGTISILDYGTYDNSNFRIKQMYESIAEKTENNRGSSKRD